MSIYGCKHEAWIGTDLDDEPSVCLANTHDGEYIQYFTEQEELLDFIRELIALHNEFVQVPHVTILVRYYQEQKRSENDE